MSDLAADHQETLRRVGGSIAYITPAEIPGAVRDIDFAYHQWFDEIGAEIAIVRPDFYVYAATTIDELPTVLDQLTAHLCLLS